MQKRVANRSREDRLRMSKIRGDRYRLKEGTGVYIATFPSGEYIGSGQITERRVKHMGGTSDIAKALNEKALNFEVIIYCVNSFCSIFENTMMDSYPKGALLNKQIYGRKL